MATQDNDKKVEVLSVPAVPEFDTLEDAEKTFNVLKITFGKNIWSIGCLLRQVKEKQLYKESGLSFYEWVKGHGMSESTARRFVTVATVYANIAAIPQLPMTTVYDLVSLPDDERQNIEAKLGELSPVDVVDRIHDARERVHPRHVRAALERHQSHKANKITACHMPPVFARRGGDEGTYAWYELDGDRIDLPDDEEALKCTIADGVYSLIPMGISLGIGVTLTENGLAYEIVDTDSLTEFLARKRAGSEDV